VEVTLGTWRISVERTAATPGAPLRLPNQLPRIQRRLIREETLR
jgi:hypothetical protein